MSHVTKDEQRDDNAEISLCMERNAVTEHVPMYDDDGELLWFDTERNYTCGPSEKISVSQDRCPTCKKIFTY